MRILRRSEMQLRSDGSPLAAQCGSDLLTKACLMFNPCIENRDLFEVASRNEYTTAYVLRNLFGEHAERSLRISVKNTTFRFFNEELCLFSLRMSVQSTGGRVFSGSWLH